jgi:hypothetical protein
VDGADVATQTIPHSIAFTVPFDETFDVGVDTRTGVNDADCHVIHRRDEVWQYSRFTRRFSCDGGHWPLASKVV